MGKTALLIVTIFIIYIFVAKLIQSIPVDRYNLSSLSITKRSVGLAQDKTESDEQFLDAGPYLSMEDLASKEKVIHKAPPIYPEQILRSHHPGESSTEDETPEEEEEDDEEETSFEESEEDEEIIVITPTTPVVVPEPSTPIVDVDDNVISTTQKTTFENAVVVEKNIIPENLQVTIDTPNTNTTSASPNQLQPYVGTNNTNLSYSHPLPLVKAPFDEEIDEKLFLTLQNSVRETYFAFRDILGTRHRTQMKTLEDDLRMKLNQLGVDLNVKVVALDTTTHSRIQTLTDQIIDQRKEDIQTFSDNLHQLQKTHQMHMDSQKVEIQQLQVTMDLLNKGQSSLATKLSQLQKLVNNLDSKVNEMVIKSSEDLQILKDSQKITQVVLDELQLEIKTNEAEFREMQEVLATLQKAATEDSGKLRRTLIRDQKQEPLQVAIRHLRNKNVGAAIKQWRSVESIADDLKETLIADISRIVEESFGKNAANLQTIADFVHRATSGGENRRLKEAAWQKITEMDSAKQLTDAKRTIEIFNLAQVMKADLGIYYNSSIIVQEIVGKLPEIIKLITFDKVKLLLPTRGYLRVAADRKVTLVPQDGKFYDKDEILWSMEYDKDKADGTFYIKSDKLQKYLVTLQEGFNSYGFSKQGLFVTGNKKENGTRFQLTIVNQGEYVLIKSVYYNGYLTWKSNVQTVYGDDDQYFLLLVDRKNGPSPYWIFKAEQDES